MKQSANEHRTHFSRTCENCSIKMLRPYMVYLLAIFILFYFISDSQKLDNLKEAWDAVLRRKFERHSKASENQTFIRLCCCCCCCCCCLIDGCISRQDITFLTEWLSHHGLQKLRDAFECNYEVLYSILWWKRPTATNCYHFIAYCFETIFPN